MKHNKFRNLSGDFDGITPTARAITPTPDTQEELQSVNYDVAPDQIVGFLTKSNTYLAQDDVFIVTDNNIENYLANGDLYTNTLFNIYGITRIFSRGVTQAGTSISFDAGTGVRINASDVEVALDSGDGIIVTEKFGCINLH